MISAGLKITELIKDIFEHTLNVLERNYGNQRVNITKISLMNVGAVDDDM